MPAPQFSVSDTVMSQFTRDLRQFAALLDKDLEKEIPVQARLTLRDCVNYTAPMVAGHGNTFQTVAPQSQRKQGEKAIENDLNRLYLVLNDLDIINNPQSKKLGQQIRRYLRTRDYEALSELLKALGVGGWKSRPEILPQVTKEHHRAQRRRSDGKVRRVKQPYLVVNAPSLAKRKREAKAKVGWTKSGWNKAARGLGLNIPNWVARHDAPGMFHRDGKAHQFSVTFGNLVSYIQNKADRITNRAIRNRSSAMRRQIEHFVNKRTRDANSRRR